jgi:hypothetical protein
MLKNLLKVSSEIPVEFEAPAEKSQYKTDLGEKLLSKSAKAGLVGPREESTGAAIFRLHRQGYIWRYLIF